MGLDINATDGLLICVIVVVYCFCLLFAGIKFFNCWWNWKLKKKQKRRNRNFWIFTNRTRSNDLKGNPTLLYWATRKSQMSNDAKVEKLNIPMNFKIHEGTESTDDETEFF